MPGQYPWDTATASPRAYAAPARWRLEKRVVAAQFKRPHTGRDISGRNRTDFVRMRSEREESKYMSPNRLEIRGFKVTFTAIGVLYILLGSSMLVRGVGVLRDFAVPEHLLSAPVFEDFFLFFYELMAFIGVLTVLFGHVTRERKAQALVASVFCLANLHFAARDLSTSDSRFGNHLYRGDATLVFVWIDLALAFAFGFLAVQGLLQTRSREASPSEPS